MFRFRTLAIFALTAILFASCSGKFTPFTFVHCTDTQIGFGDKSEGFVHSDSLLNAAVDAINSLKPEFTVVTGDLVNDVDDPLQDELFRKGIARFDIPCFLLPGNHDYRNDWTAKIKNDYVTQRGYDRFSFIKNGCAFIGIDSNCIKAKATEAENEQWDWLEGELRKARKAKFTFLFLHCPIFKKDIDEPEDYENFPMESRRKYIDLLKGYGVDAVLAGHTHKDYDIVFEGIRLVAANPVCNGIGHGQPGFNTVSLTKDGFEIEFHPTPGFDPAKCRL
ncbi:MAG: metallophosphoesterase [Bacteroidales bacterium]|nr:metallophosphoesterase [Bacteroidales bacterium]